MRVLALDAAMAQCVAAIVVDQQAIAMRREAAVRGHAGLLAVMAGAVMDEAGLRPMALDLLAVTVGPGSFTGIRAALALAHGIALAAGVPVVAVTVGEALADSLPHLVERELWSAIDSRRGSVFLEWGGRAASFQLEALPVTDARIAVAGDAAIAVAARLAARGADVMLTDARLPMARHIAVVGERRHAGILGPLPAQPLYIDPPAAKLPAGGLRPSPEV
jgi:tRNA threonylcarbamoyl adenosine modification protein YeaZ